MRAVLLIILACCAASGAMAQVVITSAADPARLAPAPDRSFPCAPLPWTDPDAPIGNPGFGSLTCYAATGVSGVITLRRAATDSIELLADPAGLDPLPLSGGFLEDAALWGQVHLQSGTAIGRCLTREPSDDVVFRDCDGSDAQHFRYDASALTLTTDDARCLEADATGARVAACRGDGSQRWVLDADGRLLGTRDCGSWDCLETSALNDGAAAVLLACALPIPPAQTWAMEVRNEPVDFAALTAGLTSVTLQGDHDATAAMSGTAVPLLVLPDGRAAAVAGTAGPSRVVAFGRWLPADGTATNDDWATLHRNIIEWTGRGPTPTIGLAPWMSNFGGPRAWLTALGYTVVDATPATLAGIDAYLLGMGDGDDGASASDIALVEAFMRRGGGIIASRASFGWWVTGTFGPADELPAALIARAGIGWTQANYDTLQDGTLFDVTQQPALREAQLAAGFEAFTRDRLGLEFLSAPELAALQAHLEYATTAPIPLTDVAPFTVAQRVLKRLQGPVLVGPAQPFTLRVDADADMALRGDYVLAPALPAQRVRAHESAALFPGLVAPAAPRITRPVVIDASVPARYDERWRSTGLYAPPGEVLTASFPPAVLSERLRLRIGASFDNPLPHVGWLGPSTFGRFPWVTAGRLVQEQELQLASAFGGPVYVEVPSGASLGDLSVELGGAVEMPPFVLGVTDPAAWAAAIADVPLAELVSDQVIITARTDFLRTLADPGGVLQALADIVAAQDEFVGVNGDHEGGESLPQRIVLDPFEEWGAHSGHPVHLTESWTESLLDRSIWPGGAGLWAFLHEVGHNHQRSWWTLDTHGEVTCNLIGCYAFETVTGLPLATTWEGNLVPATMDARTRAWLAGGGDYTTQGYDVALYFFLFVQAEFGWDPFKTMFAEYRALPAAQRPATEQEKIDQLCVRLSRAVDRNLAPWFETFRYPLSATVYPQVTGLPAWDTAPFP